MFSTTFFIASSLDIDFPSPFFLELRSRQKRRLLASVIRVPAPFTYADCISPIVLGDIYFAILANDLAAVVTMDDRNIANVFPTIDTTVFLTHVLLLSGVFRPRFAAAPDKEFSLEFFVADSAMLILKPGDARRKRRKMSKTVKTRNDQKMTVKKTIANILNPPMIKRTAAD